MHTHAGRGTQCKWLKVASLTASHLRACMRRARECVLLTGTISFRTVSLVACKLTASCAGTLLRQKRFICGTSPTVDTVTLFLLKCSPLGCVAMFMAVITALKLLKGSPACDAFSSAFLRTILCCILHVWLADRLQPLIIIRYAHSTQHDAFCSSSIPETCNETE